MLNKSQGQSPSNVGNCLSKPVFAQVTFKKGLKILILDGEDHVSTEITNVVYRGLFQNV